MKNKKANKTQQKILEKWRKAIWIVMIVFVVIFVIFALILRQSLKQINKDPSLISLNNESIFRIIQIVNRNKNRASECWNMMNPLNPCNDSNKLTPGYYELKGTRDYKWLEKSKAKIKLSDDFIRDTLAGFMLENHDYYQTIEIKYSTPDKMQISVTTENNSGDTSSQLINLNAK